jgi:hypothetical protein
MVKGKHVLVGIFRLGLLPASLLAQDKPPAPYFITYDHYMEDPDELELATNVVSGHERGLNTFLGNFNEFEYGIRKWWTTEFYLDWQHTKHEGSLFTGFRIENRFRLFLEPHKINPILYVEYEHLNGADKTLKEIVGFDSKEDLEAPNSETREEHEREIEAKRSFQPDWRMNLLKILMQNLHGERWNLIPVGLSCPLAAAIGNRCTFCASRFAAGLEVYGGWGHGATSHQRHLPVRCSTVCFRSSETVIRFSPGWA